MGNPGWASPMGNPGWASLMKNYEKLSSPLSLFLANFLQAGSIFFGREGFFEVLISFRIHFVIYTDL